MSCPTRPSVLPKLTVRAVLYLCIAATLLSGLTAYWSLQGPLEYAIERDVPSSGQHPSQLKDKARPSVAAAASPASPSKTVSPYTHFSLQHLEGGEDVELIIKTGATELFDKLPVHFVTTLTHVPHFTIFSDVDQKLGDYFIHDSLVGYSNSTKQTSEAFKLYRELLSDKTLRQDPKRLKLKGGWDLDKYKFTYTLSKVFEMRPNAKWYMFIEADTYIMWPNFLRWLKDKDHTKPSYYGSPAAFKDVTFGHGGTGYLVSKAAMEMVMGRSPDIVKSYEYETSTSCCGDHVIGKVFIDHGIELTRASPSFNGEPPYLVAFAEDRWCEPVVTFHHMLPTDVEDMWEYERENATANSDILFVDIFDHFVKPYLMEERDGWDNGSEAEQWDDVEFKDNLTFADCKMACEADNDCWQFMFKKNSCKTSHNLKGGWRLPDGDEMRS
ncbi:hypothetical protein GP486_008497, partial [Trichoglossum hirsutum]